jgi:HAD superfamily hydrolase (TIGR01490 family)
MAEKLHEKEPRINTDLHGSGTVGIRENPCKSVVLSGPNAKTAAFYDLDGTLAKGNVLKHYLYYALTDASLSGRVRRLAETVAKAPLWIALERLDRRTFNEHFYRSYAGLSEDRVRVLGADLFDAVVKPAIFPGARDLVAADARAGHMTVLITGALDVVAEPLAKHLGIEKFAANRLAFDRDGIATGALEPPVLAGPEKAVFLRRFAAEHGIDLERSRAYADDAADLPLLSSVGRPIAVNAEPRLRATAIAHGWPVINLAATGDGPATRTRPGVFDRAVDGALSVLRLLEKKS